MCRARRYPLTPEWLWQHGAAGPVCQASLEPAPLGWCNSCYRSIRSSILERTILDIQYPTASGIYRRNNRSITNRDYALSCSELAGEPETDVATGAPLKNDYGFEASTFALRPLIWSLSD